MQNRSVSELMRGVHFKNMEERAVAKLLAKYLGLHIREIVTFQRPIDAKRRLDFFLEDLNIAFEWHPIILKFYMHERDYKHFRLAIKGIQKEKQESLREIMKNVIRTKYERERRDALLCSHDEKLQRSSLVICETPQELYHRIIKPYSDTEVKIAQIIKEFNMYKKEGRARDLK